MAKCYIISKKKTTTNKRNKLNKNQKERKRSLSVESSSFLSLDSDKESETFKEKKQFSKSDQRRYLGKKNLGERSRVSSELVKGNN